MIGKVADRLTQAQAARLMNVSTRSVGHAAVVTRHGCPELVSAVTAGLLATSVASEVARLPHDRQREVLALEKKQIRQVATQIREDRRRRTRPRERVYARAALLLSRAAGLVREAASFLDEASSERLSLPSVTSTLDDGAFILRVAAKDDSEEEDAP